ncbi:MAG: hypothetical protein J2P46_22950 [Zavarzinella sp.]|nr:hypothetical protein [Zavarzinella sp.]
MTISSRTPEGDPNQCPICGHHVRIEPSLDTRDAPCPRCGHLLWFSDDITRRYPDLATKWWSVKERVINVMTQQLGPPSEAIRMVLQGLSPSKFEKVDWDFLLKMNTWDELLVLVRAERR